MNSSMRKLKRRLMTLKSMLIPYNKRVSNIDNIKRYEDEAERISENLYFMRRGK